MKNIQQKHANAKGFTLIELMIVVAIIGVLAAVALPAYSDYTIRARVSEIILAASSCRTDITEFAQTNNALPQDSEAACSGSSQYVASVEWAGGVVTATAAAAGTTGGDELGAAAGGTITLTPQAIQNGNIPGWDCAGNIPEQFRPGSCRG
ncbi:MAG: pilin [Pseudomonadota bacterium]